MSDCSTDRTGRRSRGGSMAPPPSTSSGAPSVHPAIREITEDTPPDLLEGAMELIVVLPSTSTARMTVERRTPMMDLLIHVGTINKLNPGDHIVQVRNERGIELPYKPSTPIGALDTNVIEIVPKNRVSDYIIVKKPAKIANQPFEHTFRLQVHLPRNQLYVMRVSMKTVLGDILKEVCQEKNLDIQKYEVRHPGNLDERLPLHGTLGEFGLQEITVVSKNTKISSSVSSADIIALQQTDEGRGKGYLDSSFKHSRSSVGDSSVSSGSTGSNRGLSPTRSDDSRSVSPFPLNSAAKQNRHSNCGSSTDDHPRAVHKSVSMSNMFSPGSAPPGIQAPPRQKKRAAPLPPPFLKSQTESVLSMCADSKLTPRKKEAPRAPIVKSDLTSSAMQLNQSIQSNHSRHNSGSSSGYNEATSVLTKYEYDRQTSAPAMLSKQTTARSVSNLTTTSSISNTSLASSTGGSKKRRAPIPPSNIPAFRPQSEIEEEDSEVSVSSPSKSDKSCQSSVQVEVDVHYRKNSTHAPISVNTSKEEDSYSSNPASSLSSPGSYLSTSSTSSPLPRTESPLCNSSKPISSPSSSSSVPVDSLKSNYCAGSDTPSNMQPSDDPVGSTQVPAPLPPPRTKAREGSLPDDTIDQPQPKPRPKPRSDRKSIETLDPIPLETSKPKVKPEPQSVQAPQLRNPLSKFGVKVLPDNVLKERAERLAKVASTELEENNKPPPPPPTTAPPKKGAAPPPPVSKVQPPLPPSSKNSAFKLQKKDSDTSTQSEPDNKTKPKDDLKKYKVLSATKQKSGSSMDEDSDNLEENLELFEPTSSLTRHNPPNVQNVQISIDSPKSSLSSGTSTSQHKPKAKAPPIPVITKQLEVVESIKPRVISSSVSDLKDLERKAKGNTQLSSEANNNDLVRTNSDRFQKGPTADDENLLNRWGNLESLHEIGDSSSDASKRTTNKLSEGFPSTSTTKYTKRSDPHRNNSSMQSSSDGLHDAVLHKVSHHEEVDDAGLTSSESEVSYTDSGVPTTETITPSPMDFDARISDHDEDDEETSKHQLDESRGSSNRSSFQSGDEDHWKNVLQEKSINSQEAQEKSFASMIPQQSFYESTRDTSETTDTTIFSSKEKETYSEPDTKQEKVNASGSSSRSSSESIHSRKVSKSESFSHNSEFDIVQMKRKQFLSSSKKLDVTRGHSSTDLASSHHSSSEDDLRPSGSSGTHQENRSSATDSDDNKANSMHNLNSNVEKNDVVQLRNKGEKSEASLQKSQSLLTIQGMHGESSENPEVIKARLEAQFEQWKLDFLKQQGTIPSSTLVQSEDSEPVMVEESNSAMQVDSSTTHPSEDLATTAIPEQEILSVNFANLQSVTPNKSVQASVDEPEGIRTPEYKYTGPPTIKIGAYTARTNISVKKDEDYIMGFGQANPKVSPAAQSTKPRPHSYTPNAYPSQSFASEKPQANVPLRSVVETVTSKPATSSPSRGISATLNARPVSSGAEESVGNVKSVLSTWKQRVADNEHEKKSPHGPPPEIDIYGGESSYSHVNSTPPVNKLKNITARDNFSEGPVIVSNEPKMKIVDGRTTPANFNVSKEKFNIEPAKSKVPTQAEKSSSPSTLDKRPDTFSKPLFSIAAMESKPKPSTQPPANKVEITTPNHQDITATKPEAISLRKSQITLDISGTDENAPSLNERRKYFQGIQPVESPSKETPLPAVNMKSSIATIQKVFQQRQQTQDSSPAAPKGHPTVQRSMTLPSKSNVVAESPVLTQQNSFAYSSTMPKHFQPAMSSTEMVQRVLGKSSKSTHDAFRKSPSPISSTTSTLSRDSFSGRDAPSSSNTDDSGVSGVRVTNESKKASHNIMQNDGNKAVIIVNGPDSTNPPPKPIGSNNIFKFFNNKNSSSTPKKAPFTDSSIQRTNSINSTTIIINGNSEKKVPLDDRRGSKSEKPVVVEQTSKVLNSSVAKRTNETNLKPNSGVPPPPPPPPPPPNPGAVIMRPQDVSLKSRPTSVSLSSSPGSKATTPTSPNSDPRSEIFNVIKQSNGNFGLKKTGSTFLLK